MRACGNAFLRARKAGTEHKRSPSFKALKITICMIVLYRFYFSEFIIAIPVPVNRKKGDA
jgi:hypothetical protein